MQTVHHLLQLLRLPLLPQFIFPFGFFRANKAAVDGHAFQISCPGAAAYPLVAEEKMGI
jgi:hypothetical protein